MELGMKSVWVLHKLHKFTPVMLEALELRTLWVDLYKKVHLSR